MHHVHSYDEDEAKDRKKKRGKHGDVDEMDFDEVWQDDEEMPADMPGFDDDAKDDVSDNPLESKSSPPTLSLLFVV